MYSKKLFNKVNNMSRLYLASPSFADRDPVGSLQVAQSKYKRRS